jgi:hypothetical protein
MALSLHSHISQDPRESATFHFSNIKILLSCMWTHIFFFLIFHFLFNYYYNMALRFHLQSTQADIRTLSSEFPYLCMLLLCSTMHWKHWGWLFPDESFLRQASHFISLGVIGAKIVFDIVTGVPCRFIKWMTK